MLQPPALTKKLDTKAEPLTYQFPHLNTAGSDIREINSSDVARQKQSMTRIKVETFSCEGKTFVAIEQNGVLIVREDS